MKFSGLMRKLELKCQYRIDNSELLFFSRLSKQEDSPRYALHIVEIKISIIRCTNLDPNQASIWLVRTSVFELLGLVSFIVLPTCGDICCQQIRPSQLFKHP